MIRTLIAIFKALLLPLSLTLRLLCFPARWGKPARGSEQLSQLAGQGVSTAPRQVSEEPRARDDAPAAAPGTSRRRSGMLGPLASARGRTTTRIAVLLAVTVSALMATLLALSYFSATTTAEVNTVSAATIGAGLQPTATVSGRDVTLSWGAAAYATSYTVARTDVSPTGLSTTVSGSCAGSIAGLTCTDLGLPESGSSATTWTFTDTPFYRLWQGSTSPATSTVTVPAPVVSLAFTTFTTAGGSTNLTVASFFDNEGVTYCLDQSSSCSGADTLGTGTVPGSGGSVTDSISIPAGLTVGPHTVYAIGSDGSLASEPITINPGAGTKLAITSAPINTIASGSATSPFTVTLEDAFGNPTTNGSGITINLAANPALGAKFAAMPGGSGVASVSLGAGQSSVPAAFGDTLAGTPTITASVTGGTPSSAMQIETITAAGANALTFVQGPSNATAGVANSPAVTVQIVDPFGNPVSESNVSVLMAVTTGPGVFAGSSTTTELTNASGFATFSNLVLDTAGNYTITASSSSPALTSPASGSFTIGVAGVTHLSVSAPLAATAGSPFSVTVTALDQFGNVVTGYAGTVHFTTSDAGSGTVLPANYTFQAGDDGVHTFTGDVTLVTAGSQTVTATDTVTPSITGSAPVQVSAAGATHLSVSAPSTATAGSPFSVTVSALDQFGNVVTGYAGTVHFTTTDTGTGTVLPANYTFQAGDDGVHTFTGDVTLVTAGNQTLTATDKTTASITGTSGPIAVSAGALASLTLAPNSGTETQGVAFNVTVTATDAYGNVKTNYTGTVHFSSSDGAAALPANYTFTSGAGDDNGVHTFSVTLYTPSSQTVTVNDTVATSITASGIYTVPSPGATLAGVGASTCVTSSSNQVVVNYPASVAPGDLLLLVVANGAQQSADFAQGGDSTGWSAASSDSSYPPSQQGGGILQQELQVFWSVAAAGSNSVTARIQTNASGACAWVLDYKGITNPVINGTTVFGIDDGVTTLTPPTFSTTAADASVISLAEVAIPPNTTPSAPSLGNSNGNAFASATSQTGRPGGANNQGIGLSVANESVASAGAVTSPVWSESSTSQWAYITLAFSSDSLVFTNQVAAGASWGVVGSAMAPQPVITVEEANGATDTSYDGTVTLTGTGSGSFSCPTSTTTVTAVNGVATFAGCQWSATGTSDRLTASSGALPNATSNSFTIGASPSASGITFTAPSSTANNSCTAGTGDLTWTPTPVNDSNAFPNAICDSDGNSGSGTFSWEVELASGTPASPTAVGTSGPVAITVTSVTPHGMNGGKSPTGPAVGASAIIPAGSAATSSSFKVANIGGGDWIAVTVSVTIGSAIYTLEMQVH